MPQLTAPTVGGAVDFCMVDGAVLTSKPAFATDGGAVRSGLTGRLIMAFFFVKEVLHKRLYVCIVQILGLESPSKFPNIDDASLIP